MRFAAFGTLIPALILFAAAGCGSNTPVPVPVHGKVTVDGTPLKEGQISFITPGQVPEVIEIKDGIYDGLATWGARRVEVGAYRPYNIPPDVPKSMHPLMQGGKENYLPEKYNYKSTLAAEVAASGPNEFNFELSSK